MKNILGAILATTILAAIVVSSAPALAQSTYAMKVSSSDSSAYYNSFEEGWTAAVESAKTKNTVITLGKNWLAGDANSNGIIDGTETTGNFSYYKNGVECGTTDGSLLLKGSLNLTIDLNGHTINRGLTAEKDDGHVFKITEGAKLTVTDTSANADGVVTGGNNTDYGGGFYVDSRAALTLDGGKISGNHAGYGGGVYVCNASFFMNAGSVEKNSAEYGGGINLDKKYNADREYIVCKGGKISDNNARVGGGLNVDSGREDVTVTFENTEISNNFATDAGGGIYIGFSNESCEVCFGKGTIITGNVSNKGGGVYADCGGYRIIDARITDNRAFTVCGGVGVPDDMDDNAHGNIWEYGVYTLGGAAYVQGNYVQADNSGAGRVPSNLHIGDGTCDLYYDASNPFTENTSIGIDMFSDFGRQESDDKLSDDKGNFAVDSFKYFTVDNPSYIITARDSGDDEGTGRYQIYLEMAGAAMEGGITGVTVKPAFRSETAPVIDKENKSVTFTVNPEMKKCLENVSLYNFADFSYGTDGKSIYGGDKTTDLLGTEVYVCQVMKGKNTYDLWTIKILPFGGVWSEKDGSAARVTVDGKTKYYADFENAWIDTIDASLKSEPLLVLNKDWYAGDADADGNIDPGETKGVFKVEKNGSECGTNSGRLYLGDNMRLTIDLNGHIISRNLTEATSGGQVFYLEDQDIVLTIKDSTGGGKITGANNKGNGGAFFVYNGNLNIEGGEISGNKAANGAGIYWDSRNKLCIYGGKITANAATVSGGGVYGADWGRIYFGGTAVINGNTANGRASNLYLSEKDVDINSTAGQADGVPYKPLTEGADIGISADDTEDLISESNSCFNEGDFRFMHSDDSRYFIRSVYDEDGGNHAHKLYINAWGDKDARYPRVKTVSVKNSALLESAVLDYDTQIITLTAYITKKSSFGSVSLDSLIECTFDKEIYYLYESDLTRDLRTTQEYKIMSDNGTYVMCIVKVEWVCRQHSDTNGDFICDACGKYTPEDFAIINYIAETKGATVFVPVSGRYALIFADYENDCLENVEIVENDFKEGINIILQSYSGFTLGKSDKVMLWYDKIRCIPICDALTLE